MGCMGNKCKDPGPITVSKPPQILQPLLRDLPAKTPGSMRHSMTSVPILDLRFVKNTVKVGFSS